MKYCDKCHVSIRGEQSICPLCQGVIQKGKEETIFPYIPTIYKKYQNFFRILLLICVTISSICVFLNILIPTKVKWSLFVIAAFICLILLLRISINKRYNMYKTVMWQVIFLSSIACLWDYFTGWHNWSIDYAIPAICLIGSIDITILSVVMKLYIDENLIYLVVVALLGLVPIIFLCMHLLTTTYLSLICVFLNSLLLIFILILKGEPMKEELKKRFHI